MRHILGILSVAATVAALTVSGVGCPFAYCFGIPCPTCGVTRALLALMRADWRGYLALRPMAVPLVVALWLMLHRKLFRHRRAVFIYVVAVLSCNTVWYLLRFAMQIPVPV